jgi:hypothetical protein
MFLIVSQGSNEGSFQIIQRDREFQANKWGTMDTIKAELSKIIKILKRPTYANSSGFGAK